MPYRIKRKESVQSAVRRLTCERVDHALDCLAHGEEAAAIHAARKDIKKIRAVLRLLRQRISKKDFQRLAKHLRKAARCLGPARDAYTQSQMLGKLVGHFKRELNAVAVRPLQANLRNRCAAAMTRFRQKNSRAAIARSFRNCRRGLKRLRVNGGGWKAVGAGVAECHAAGRAAYRRARGEPSPENFHAWRKCAKDLWYQIRLLRRIWPDELNGIAAELKHLGDWLGDDHDLAMLVLDMAEADGTGAQPSDIDALRGLAQVRQGELRTNALELGERFYGEDTTAFCERLGGYWKSWRNQRSQAAA
ncbi:MAG TPA: CHAD domain-containing protein [Opitutaceae bacterium]|nr:CHAD domain-containing protein [Opitutaceae bacterium]